MKYLPFLVLVVALLQGCAEGGTGGTGGITPVRDQSPTMTVSVTGRADKGPYAAGATLRAAMVEDGLMGPARVVGTGDDLGRFEIDIETTGLAVVSIDGPFFAEIAGELVDPGVALEALLIGQGAVTNINLLTHLAVPRALALVRTGIAPSNALDMVTAELRLALQPVLPAPSGTADLHVLGVLNATDTIDTEGNAWLLALSAVTEAAVADRVAAGAGSQVAWRSVLNNLRADLADDGAFSQVSLDMLIEARGAVDADRVVANLLLVDESLSRELLADAAYVSGLCTVSAGRLDCNLEVDSDIGPPADAGQSPAQGGGFDAVVANLNLFLDTDGDGLVNTDDDDDDGDGIVNEDDPLPYQS